MLAVQKLLVETAEAGLIEESNCRDLDIKLSTPLLILEDNKATIDWSNKSTSSQRMRHIERSLYWIRQYVQNNSIKLVHVKTEDQLADIGTKPVNIKTFQSLSQRIINYFV